MTRDQLRAKANELPLLPGVYLMMDKTGQVIYVGKAKKLKNRVSQYFQDTASHNEKTKMMVAHVDRFDTIIVRSEFEALVLENSLIKRHQPRYNILLKDDKGYPFVRLDEKSSYPRFSLVNRTADDGARYYGPFGGRHETRLALDAVCAALRLPTCSRRFPRDIGKERPCLNFHMGRCDGFCRGQPDGEEYRRRMAQAASLLEGRLRAVTGELTERMTAAAEALDFETAAALRDQIKALSVLSKEQRVIAGICADTDVWGAYTSPARSGVAVLHIENGDLLARQTEVFPDAADSEDALLSAVVPQYYLSRQSLPREILLPAAMEDAGAFCICVCSSAIPRQQIQPLIVQNVHLPVLVDIGQPQEIPYQQLIPRRISAVAERTGHLPQRKIVVQRLQIQRALQRVLRAGAVAVDIANAQQQTGDIGAAAVIGQGNGHFPRHAAAAVHPQRIRPRADPQPGQQETAVRPHVTPCRHDAILQQRNHGIVRDTGNRPGNG